MLPRTNVVLASHFRMPLAATEGRLAAAIVLPAASLRTLAILRANGLNSEHPPTSVILWLSTFLQKPNSICLQPSRTMQNLCVNERRSQDLSGLQTAPYVSQLSSTELTTSHLARGCCAFSGRLRFAWQVPLSSKQSLRSKPAACPVLWDLRFLGVLLKQEDAGERRWAGDVPGPRDIAVFWLCTIPGKPQTLTNTTKKLRSRVQVPARSHLRRSTTRAELPPKRSIYRSKGTVKRTVGYQDVYARDIQIPEVHLIYPVNPKAPSRLN